jgi:hypothetical protein
MIVAVQLCCDERATANVTDNSPELAPFSAMTWKAYGLKLPRDPRTSVGVCVTGTMLAPSARVITIDSV